MTSTHTLTLDSGHSVGLTVDEFGPSDQGHPFLFLHGGAGPLSVAGFARLLTEQRPGRVVAPINPGFNGTVRPQWLTTPRQLAEIYVALLEQLDLADVTVFGSSIGGWVAAEIALLASPRVSSVVIVDAVGILVDEHPVADFFALGLNQLAELSYHQPAKFRLDPSAMTEQQRADLAANREAIRVYGGGSSMTDPTLRGRLAAVTVPTLVLWGESDGIATPEYGRAFAEAIPTATFTLVRAAGHLPQVEAPEPLVATVWDFADAHAERRADPVS